jgi:hypothetical protein
MLSIHRNQSWDFATRVGVLWAIGIVGVAGIAQAAPVDLLVSSRNSDNVLRYDGVTGAFLGRVGRISGRSTADNGNSVKARGELTGRGTGASA